MSASIRNQSRRSIRLSDFDYSQPGDSFVTRCTHQREPLFGKILAGQMILSPFGKIVSDVRQFLPSRYPKSPLVS
jgi:hypothetical protein